MSTLQTCQKYPRYKNILTVYIYYIYGVGKYYIGITTNNIKLNMWCDE